MQRRGVTLLEVMLVLALVIALALAGFFALRSTQGNAEAAEADGRLAAVAGELNEFHGVYDTFTSFPADLGQVAGVEVSNGEVSVPGVVSVAVGETGSVGLATVASSGVCRVLGLPAPDRVTVQPAYTALPNWGLCEGAAALPAGELEAVESRTSSAKY